MTDLPRINIIPIPKFKIGDTVFTAEINSARAQHPCPDCLGTRKWKIITPAGATMEAACQRCGQYGNNDLPSLFYQTWESSFRRLTIGSIEIKTAPSYGDYVSYMCEETGVGSGTVHSERLLFETEQQAIDEALRLVIEKKIEKEKEPAFIEGKRFAHLQMVDALFKSAHDAIFNSWWAYRHLRDDMAGFLEGTTSQSDLKSNIEWTLSYDQNHRSAKALFELIIQRAAQVGDEELGVLIAQLPHQPIEKKKEEENVF